MDKLILFDSDFGTILRHRISASARGRKKFAMPVPTHQFKICSFTEHDLGLNNKYFWQGFAEQVTLDV